MRRGIILSMSLATRCPACGTVFRVVQDQLKVSGGWVRCGQCHQVFNGLQSLFELPPDPPVAAPAPQADPDPVSPGLFQTRVALPPAPAPVDAWEPTETVSLDDWAAEPMASTVDLADVDEEPTDLIDSEASEAAPSPLPWAYQPQLADDVVSEVETEMPADDAQEQGVDAEFELEGEAPSEVESVSVEALLAKMDGLVQRSAGSFVISQPPALPASWQVEAQPATAEVSAPDVAPEPLPPEQGGLPLQAEGPAELEVPAPDKAARSSRRKRHRKPAFMRQAEHAARWRRPAVRALLGGTSAILGLMLAAQVAHHQRDDLASRWPAFREPLAAWCRLAACQLQAPRALASLTLDSSALSRTARPQVLRFEVELRNSAGYLVRPPALEVSFTDNLGQQLARKVLLPEQMGAPAEGLPPERAWHIEVPLQVGDLQIAGFTAEVFYP